MHVVEAQLALISDDRDIPVPGGKRSNACGMGFLNHPVPLCFFQAEDGKRDVLQVFFARVLEVHLLRAVERRECLFWGWVKAGQDKASECQRHFRQYEFPQARKGNATISRIEEMHRVLHHRSASSFGEHELFKHGHALKEYQQGTEVLRRREGLISKVKMTEGVKRVVPVAAISTERQRR